VHSSLKRYRSLCPIAAFGKLLRAVIELSVVFVTTITALVELTRLICVRLGRSVSKTDRSRPKRANTEPELKQDDVYCALRSLGCTVREAKFATVAARKELGLNARDEDLVRVALRSLGGVR